MDLEKQILSDINIYQKYARYLPQKNRRETWSEIVDRNKLMHLKKYPALYKEIEEAYQFVYDRKLLPSMRSLQFAGKPIEINPSRIFNCAYCPMDHPDVFAETMFLLLSGVGVGYSVQTHHIKNLPEIRKSKRTRRYLIGDSIEGWSDSIKVLMQSYFEGTAVPVFDFGDIRVKGALLITSGGKAPGPAPLRLCLDNIKRLLDKKQDGEQLKSIEIHDINCYIADAVLAGGIRRSAMISLFDLDDDEMVKCKSNLYLPPTGNEARHDTENDIHQFYVEYQGDRHSITLSNGAYEQYIKDNTLPWYFVAPHRGRANNSAVILRHRIEKDVFFELWKKIQESNAGEPGIFFTNNSDIGTNPCCEIGLKSNSFCNLVEIDASDINSQEELNARARAGAFIATLQAGYTNFHYLRDKWKEATDKDALIGVSMTGIANGDVLKLNLDEAAEVVKKENDRVAKLIGINKAARCTTVKPSGNASVVLGTSSGIHAWHSKYYLRRIRVGKNETIYFHLAKHYPELLENDQFNSNQAIIAIPQKAPEHSITRDESALDLLNRVGYVWEHWIKTGHRKGSNTNNVSCTVTIKPNEWKEVGEWMWKNRDRFTALSVLPEDLGSYVQAPFETITKKKYEELVQLLHEVDLSTIDEAQDNTTLQEELACSSNGCEVI
jgi:ribonucleoside-diphosphate reductase alpha chain